MIARLRTHDAWTLMGVIPRAGGWLAAAWWTVLVLRGILPALLPIATGHLVGAVQRGEDPMPAIVWLGVLFISLLMLGPAHQMLGALLGDRTAAWLYDRLTDACVQPPGMGHLENPALANDLTMARDFDLGIAGPPLSLSLNFVAAGLVDMLVGLASAVVLAGYAWWAPLLLAAAWLCTHWLLRESAIWKDRNTDEVREAQRHSDYLYRLAVDPPAAKELRLFGLAAWTVERFHARRMRLYDLRWQATRLRERPVIWSLVLVLGANVLLFWLMASSAANGTLPLDRMVTYATAGVTTSLIAFGGLSWALDGAAAPAAAVMRLQGAMAAAGALSPGTRAPGRAQAHEIRFRDVTFAYPLPGAPHPGAPPSGGTIPGGTPGGATPGGAIAGGADAPSERQPVLHALDLTIPAGTSLAIVGQNGAGKTTLAKLLCRLYDPQSGAIEVDGVDLRDFALDEWRARVTAVFQDFIRFELPLRDNVAPRGAPDDVIRAALAEAGATHLTNLDTILARGYEGGTDLSGGQWQRIALARALCAVRLGAGLVLLDEPTAQLDVRGEAEIFERILAATRQTTTILISHRFSTVRQADRICVLEGGRVVELGTHDELMAAHGRYRTMFDLQASRFSEEGDGQTSEKGGRYDVLA